MTSQLWQVVGGGEKGGLLVRESSDTKSTEVEGRLSKGALVKQLKLDGERLQYLRVSGPGPDSGWVSTELKGKPLLERRAMDEVVALRPPEDAWRVIYFDAPHRGEQLRLLLHFKGVAFEDIRGKVYPDDLNPFKSWVAGDASPLAFDQAPILQHGGLSISQTTAAMQYASEVLGLVEGGAAARAEAQMLALGSEDMRDKVFYTIHGATMERLITAFETQAELLRTDPREALEAIGKDPTILQLAFAMNGEAIPYKRWHEHFERYLRARAGNAGPRGGPFLTGASICYADIALWECCTAIWSFPACEGQKRRLQRFPLLCALVDRVREQLDAAPRAKAYLDARGTVWNYDLKQHLASIFGEDKADAMFELVPPALKSKPENPC